MATQKLTALVPLKFGGKRLAVGDAFEASSVNARLLIALKKAKAAEAKPAAPKPAASKPAPGAKAPTAEPAPTTEPVPPSTAVPGITTKTYKTRDETPEK